MRKSASRAPKSTPKVIEAKTRGLPDWRNEMISRLRRLIEAADPAAVEEQKWKKPSNPAGVPVWYHDGILCHVVSLKNRDRLTFLKGASLKDSKGLFNACLEGNAMRAIDIREGDGVDEEAIKALVRAAAAQNAASARG